jgi:hypothetical protein
MTLWSWNKLAGSNDSADATINWSEGQVPSTVNNSARAMMAATAKWRDDVNGLTTGGSTTAYTVTSNQVYTSLTVMDGAQLTIVINATNTTTTPTLNVDGLGAKSLRFFPGQNPPIGSFLASTPYRIRYSNSASEWVVVGQPGVLLSQVGTSAITDDAVTYAKIQNVTNARFLGNFSGSTGDVSEYAIGAGLSVAGATLSSSNAYMQSGYKNLSIKVATNTTIAVAADYVCMFDGTNFRTAAISATCNLGTSGAVNALDAGTIASNTGYYIWAISNGSTDGALASTSSTAPTTPSGYNYKARIGWVHTMTAAATLRGSWQFGNRAQYLVGVGALTAGLAAITGSSGNIFTPTWTSVSMTDLVPSTAAAVSLFIQMPSGSSTSVIAAPTNSYGGVGSTTNPPPLSLSQFLTAGAGLNSNNPCMQMGTFVGPGPFYYASSSGAGSGMWIDGWIDNI